MTVSPGAARRQVLPRWRPWRLTAVLGEAASPPPTGPAQTWPLDSLISEYRERPHLGRASDLLTVASTYGERDAALLDIAKDVAETAKGTPLGELAAGLVEGDQERHNRSFEPESIDSRERLRRLKVILIREPRNAVRWMDLAREYLILGHPVRARRAVGAALQLAPNDRFVLRSATAFYAHQDEVDAACFLLRRSPRTRRDPWLLASLVAIEDLSKGKHHSGRDALRLLDGDFPDTHLAELAAAIGTIELSAGSARRGRRLLKRSVVAPNENALAQVEWLSVLKNQFIADTTPELVPRAFEASARRAESLGLWVAVVQSTRLWMIDQPFSAAAAMFGSFAACESEDWNMSREFAKAGLQSNPDNPTLLNNLAFGEVGSGNLLEAVTALERARKLVGSTDQRLALAATEALFLFRIGMVELGRRRYESVINAFGKVHDSEHAAKAALMLAREELMAQSDSYYAAWKRADHLARNSARPHVRQLHQQVSLMVSGKRGAGAASPKSDPRALKGLAVPLLPEPEILTE